MKRRTALGRLPAWAPAVGLLALAAVGALFAGGDDIDQDLHAGTRPRGGNPYLRRPRRSPGGQFDDAHESLRRLETRRALEVLIEADAQLGEARFHGQARADHDHVAGFARRGIR